MSDVGVVVAMRWEAHGLAGRDDRLALAGPGADRAEQAARYLVREGVDALVSWGVAAGLDPSLAPGTLLLPERVLAANGDCYSLTGAWHTRAVEHTVDAAPVLGPLAETVSLLPGPSAKAALQARTGAIAADMESAAVVRVARDSRLPVLVVRAVLDAADVTLPEAWSRVAGPDGGLRPGAVIAAAARPALWKDGLALARCRRLAARSLRAAAPLLFGE